MDRKRGKKSRRSWGGWRLSFKKKKSQEELDFLKLQELEKRLGHNKQHRLSDDWINKIEEFKEKYNRSPMKPEKKGKQHHRTKSTHFVESTRGKKLTEWVKSADKEKTNLGTLSFRVNDK